MSEDDLYLLFYFYLIQLGTMIIWIRRSKDKKRAGIINISVFILYNVLFHYNLIYNSSGGSGLVWFFYLILSLGLHWLINTVGIIKTFVFK